MKRMAILLATTISCLRGQTVRDTALMQPDFPDVDSEILDDASSDELRAERLADLEAHPLDLNHASVDDLQQIPGVDASLATEIVQRRAQHPYGRLGELLHAPAMTMDRLKTIQRFVAVYSEGDVSANRLEVRGRGLRNAENDGASDEMALEPWKNKVRFLMARQLIPYSTGAGLKVDAGLASNGEGRDGILRTVSAWFGRLQLATPGIMVAAGEYLVESGRGLVFWRPYARERAYGSGASTENGRGFIPTVSATEESSLRGLACGWRDESVQVDFFNSTRSYGARVDPAQRIVSLTGVGLSALSREPTTACAVQERIIGGRIRLATGSAMRLEVSGNASWWSHAFGFASRELSVAGASVVYRAEDAGGGAGEVALSGAGKSAGVVGAWLVPSSWMRFSVDFRWYDHGFVSIHGNGPSAGRRQGQAEQGFCAGFDIIPVNQLSLSLRADQFTMGPAPVWNAVPWSGHDVALDLRADVGTKTSVRLQYRDRRTQTSSPSASTDEESDGWSEQVRKALRVSLRHSVRGTLQLETKMQWATSLRVQPAGRGVGFMIGQDFGIVPVWWARLRGGIAVFETNGSDGRLYDREVDLRGLPGLVPMSGRGIRWHFLAAVRITRGLDLSAKYVQTVKNESASRPTANPFLDDVRVINLGLQLDATIGIP